MQAVFLQHSRLSAPLQTGQRLQITLFCRKELRIGLFGLAGLRGTAVCFGAATTEAQGRMRNATLSNSSTSPAAADAWGIYAVLCVARALLGN